MDWLFHFGWQLFQRLPGDPQQHLLAILVFVGVVLIAIMAFIHRRNTKLYSNQVIKQSINKISSPEAAPSVSNVTKAELTPERPKLRLSTGEASTPPGNQKNRLVIFVHGLLSSEQRCWGEFPNFLLEDPEIAAEYDVATFGYESGVLALKQVPPLEDVARYLDDEIEIHHENYAEIVIFAHSMGGLIARRYLADALERAKLGGKPCRVSRVLFFATPHRGSAVATIAGLGATAAGYLVSLFGSAAKSLWDAAVANGTSEQLKALSSGSNFIFQLERDEEAVQTRDRLTMRYIMAETDIAVDKNSAVGSSAFHIIPGADH